MSDAKLPQRYDLVGEYDSYMSPIEQGDYVRVEDVQPLLAEIERLRARVEVLERAMRGIAEYCDEGDRRTFLAVANTARAALKEAKP
jgi:hypothetical protein